MTITQLRTEIDTRLTNLWGNIVTRQTNHYNNRGRYWQGGWTCNTLPACVTADTAFPDTATDGTSVVSSETGGWAQVPGFPAAMCYRLRIDVWEAEIKGFTAIVQVRFNNQTYERIKSYPDDRYTMGWHTVK